MRLWSAALFLLWSGGKNRVLRQLRRLKRPGSAIGFAFGLAYFWFFFGRLLSGLQPLASLPLTLSIAHVLMPLFGMFSVVSLWLLGDDEAGLTFTEAEIQLLFPAPVSRRALLHYKALRSIGVAGFGAAMTTLAFGRRVTLHPWPFFLGSWLAFATLGLHGQVAVLARQSLSELGIAGLRRTLPTWLAVLALFGGTGFSVWRGFHLPDSELSPVQVALWVRSLLDLGLLPWVMWPFRQPVGVALAQDAETLLRHLLPSVAMLVGHHAWLVRSQVRFEEAALAASRNRAERIERWQSGGRVAPLGHQKAPFALAGSGAPWVALVWKNLIAAVRRTSIRLTVLAFILMSLFLGVLMSDAELGMARLGVLGAFAIVALFVALFGALSVRLDFRNEIPQLELLRAMPLAPWEVSLGLMLVPWLLVAGATVALLALGFLLSLFLPVEGLARTEALSLTLAAIALLPAFTGLQLAVQNAAALLFPTLANVRQRGFEALGQRLVGLAGNIAVAALGLLPAAALGFGVGFVALLVVQLPFAVLLGSTMAATVLYAELAAAIWGLGRLYARFDVGRG